MTIHPKVSIGVPVFNGENYLAEMLDSLMSQTFDDFEVIISDNASTDSTLEVVRAAVADDSRFRVFSTDTNRGAGWNFNRVLELAEAPLFKWQAHDDLLAPTYLERCLDLFERSPHLGLVHTAVDMVGPDLALIEHYGIRLRWDDPDPVVRFEDMVLPWNLCFEIFGVIRRDLLATTDGMGSFSHGDGILLAHLALLAPFAFVDEPLFLSRQHERQSMQRFGLDYHAYATWFDPSHATHLQFPNWKMLSRFDTVIRRVEGLSVGQRLRCRWILARWVRAHVRPLARDVTAGASWTAAELRRRLVHDEVETGGIDGVSHTTSEPGPEVDERT